MRFSVAGQKRVFLEKSGIQKNRYQEIQIINLPAALLRFDFA